MWAGFRNLRRDREAPGLAMVGCYHTRILRVRREIGQQSPGNAAVERGMLTRIVKSPGDLQDGKPQI
jgi:hypothetical protein